MCAREHITTACQTACLPNGMRISEEKRAQTLSHTHSHTFTSSWVKWWGRWVASLFANNMLLLFFFFFFFFFFKVLWYFHHFHLEKYSKWKTLLVYVADQCCSLSPSPELPYNDYFEYFGPDFKLHISPSNMTNQNTQEYMDKIK